MRRRLLPLEYATRNLGRAPLRLALLVGGGALVALLVVAAASFTRGMERALAISGSDRNVILLGAGSEESVERSEIDPAVPAIARAALSGVRTRLGVAAISPEIHVALPVAGPDGREGLAVLRGVAPEAFLVHERVRIVAGRAPEPGADELLVGAMLGEKLGLPEAALAPGASLRIDGRAFEIVGRFAAPGTVMEAEAWCPIESLRILVRHDRLSCVVVGFEDAAATVAAETFALRRLDLELVALREDRFYAALASFFAPIRAMVSAAAGLVALAAILGGINATYAGFASRGREMATLRTIGYGRAALAVAMTQECTIATTAGALLAAVPALLLLDGRAVRFSMGAFALLVDAPVLALGLAAAIGLGVLGAAAPAWRCLRPPIPSALGDD